MAPESGVPCDGSAATRKGVRAVIQSFRLMLAWLGMSFAAAVVPRTCAEGRMITNTLAHLAQLMQIMRGAKMRNPPRPWPQPLPPPRQEPVLEWVEDPTDRILGATREARCKGRRR